MLKNATIPLLVATSLVSTVIPAPAHAAGLALPQVLSELSIFSLIGNLLSLVSLPLVIGFLAGLAAGELGKMAWKASQGFWKATVDFSSVAVQYGAIAALLACLLYFA